MVGWLAAGAFLTVAAQTPAASPGESDAARALRQSEQDQESHREAARAAKARAAAASAAALHLGAAEEAARTRLRAAEEASAAAIERRAQIRARQSALEARRDAETAQLERLLPIAVRLSLYPAETLLAVPAPPDEAVRGVAVLHGLAREIAATAAQLQADRAALAAIAAESVEAARQLDADITTQRSLAAALDQQIATMRQSAQADEGAALEAERAAADDAAHAADLRAALARLAADRARAEAEARAKTRALAEHHAGAALSQARQREALLAHPAGPGLGAAQGRLIAPVSGAVIGHFGAPGEAGPAEGITFRAPPEARVLSPCQGKVAFAGPFRSYGVMVIVDCGDGYDFVLAGLARLASAVGERVRAGDPVGAMAAWASPDDEKAPLLYVELRHHGQAIDPLPWLQAKG
uniref:Peptidase M23 n=1 Tax=Acidicaldus sp. TaxID=1872105 RepID=A0A8J4M569_9PROT